ncbi:metalloregulator ArsR/SmtB family transcription factor [Chitinophaga sp. ysch24]|uniref:Metalloregulator ArsR/SmtB family transcription factor n=2 Tax=Chitinophaga tropicalis TaxID=2683588 RepID=A0A7K1U1J5_9BACT|nr:metalloregulator ArsR/SmtB family transcription factor [Chitinophaga tropicalis]
MDAIMIEKAANAIADKHRLSILLAASRQSAIQCCEITELTGLSQPTVSHHIKILVDSGVLIYDKTGRTVQLTINKEMMKYLSSFFDKLS